MKKILICIITALVFSGLEADRAGAQNSEIYPNFIEVTGVAEKEVAPDVFYMRIDINELDSKGKKTLEQQQRSTISSLKSMGIDTEKQLTRLSLSSNYYNRKTNMSYASFQLKLFTPDDVSKVLMSMDALGISNVSFTKAEYSRIDELKDEVRQEAVRNAKKQAESMAEAIGQTVGKCFYMYCGSNGNSAFYAQPRMASKALMLDSVAEESIEAEALEFNNIKVSMSVSAKFVLD